MEKTKPAKSLKVRYEEEGEEEITDARRRKRKREKSPPPNPLRKPVKEMLPPMMKKRIGENKKILPPIKKPSSLRLKRKMQAAQRIKKNTSKWRTRNYRFAKKRKTNNISKKRLYLLKTKTNRN